MERSVLVRLDLRFISYFYCPVLYLPTRFRHLESELTSVPPNQLSWVGLEAFK